MKVQPYCIKICDRMFDFYPGLLQIVSQSKTIKHVGSTIQ